MNVEHWTTSTILRLFWSNDGCTDSRLLLPFFNTSIKGNFHSSGYKVTPEPQIKWEKAITTADSTKGGTFQHTNTSQVPWNSLLCNAYFRIKHRKVICVYDFMPRTFFRWLFVRLLRLLGINQSVRYVSDGNWAVFHSFLLFYVRKTHKFSS